MLVFKPSNFFKDTCKDCSNFNNCEEGREIYASGGDLILCMEFQRGKQSLLQKTLQIFPSFSIKSNTSKDAKE